MTRAELAGMLERFIGDAPGCGEWEWDDFTSVPAEAELEPYRQRLLKQARPPGNEAQARRFISELRTNASN
jgi:hypothetical protein